MSVVGAIALGLSSSALRPQTLVLPLFVALAWLLVEDARAPSRRVFWAIPLLVLWANLHGTVTLGGAARAARGRRRCVAAAAADGAHVSACGARRRVAVRLAVRAASARLLPHGALQRRVREVPAGLDADRARDPPRRRSICSRSRPSSRSPALPKLVDAVREGRARRPARARRRSDPRRDVVHAVRARRAAERASRAAAAGASRFPRAVAASSSHLFAAVAALAVAAIATGVVVRARLPDVRRARRRRHRRRERSGLRERRVQRLAPPEGTVTARPGGVRRALRGASRRPSRRRGARCRSAATTPSGSCARSTSSCCGPKRPSCAATLERDGNWRRVDAGTKVVVLRRVTG